MSEFDEALKSNQALRSTLSKVQEDLNPIRVLGLLERISSEDCELLDIHDRRVPVALLHLCAANTSAGPKT